MKAKDITIEVVVQFPGLEQQSLPRTTMDRLTQSDKVALTQILILPHF